MACDRHNTTVTPCYVCRLEVELSRVFAEEGLRWSSGPRYRYWSLKAKGRSERTFEYTTETANEGKYWAVERRWVKGTGKIIRKVGFKQRKKAKERALAWYTKAQASATSNTVG